MLVLREDVGDVGDELGLILDQRVRTFLFAGGGDALAGEHDRTHAQRDFAQIGNLHVGLERAHAAGAIFADDEFQVIAAGSEQETGVVLNVFAADLLRAVDRELYGVALMADRQFSAGENFADDVDGGVVFVFRLHERNLRAGNDERDAEIIVRIVLAEIVRAGVNRYVGLR